MAILLSKAQLLPIYQENTSNTLRLGPGERDCYTTGMPGEVLEDDLAAVLRWMVLTNRVSLVAHPVSLGVSLEGCDFFLVYGTVWKVDRAEAREVLSQ